MPKIQYQAINFRSASLDMIARANAIIAAYQRQGFALTLRQLYYRLVAGGVISNVERSYKNLGALVNDGRLAGLIDWNAIEDRTRSMRENGHWTEPESIIASAASAYAIDKWADQPFRVEVWVEKDALVGVVGRIASALDVPYFSCRGYTSQSEMWAGAMRLRKHLKAGQRPVVLHLGDHDPSGIDMSRDIRDRLEMFIGRPVTFERLALNMDQVRRYNPPPNPAKITDSRAGGYIKKYGAESWELDALEPAVISGLIESAVLRFRDEDRWQKQIGRESEDRRELEAASEHWGPLTRFMRDEDYLEEQN